MSRLLFGRYVRVEVADPTGASRAWVTRNGVGLRIKFDIKTTQTGALGSAKVSIFNLAAESVSAFRAKRAVVRVIAGYGDEAGLIFVGDITRVVSPRTGADHVTTIEASDGYAKYARVRVARAWDSTTGLAVLRGLALDAGYIVRIPSDVTDVALPGGWVAGGLFRDEFGGICGMMKLDWNIVDGIVQVIKKGTALTRTAIVLSSSTGLVGSPTASGRNVSVITSLLYPSLRVKQLVNLRAQDQRGFFRILSLKHQGDSGFEDQFYSIMEARKA